MYNDVERKEAEHCLSMLRPHSLATFKDKARSAAWKKIPSAYLVCENDRAIDVKDQDKMIASVKAAGGEIKTERLFVSHSPYLAKPGYVADFLRRAAVNLANIWLNASNFVARVTEVWFGSLSEKLLAFRSICLIASQLSSLQIGLKK